MDGINYMKDNEKKHNEKKHNENNENNENNEKILWTDLCHDKLKHKNKIKLRDAKKNVLVFIFKYASLYPAEKIESPAPEDDFKHRRIKILLKNDYSIFQELLLGATEKEEMNILTETMQIVGIFRMKILYDKIGAVITMKIKDKTPINVYELFAP